MLFKVTRLFLIVLPKRFTYFRIFALLYFSRIATLILLLMVGHSEFRNHLTRNFLYFEYFLTFFSSNYLCTPGLNSTIHQLCSFSLYTTTSWNKILLYPRVEPSVLFSIVFVTLLLGRFHYTRQSSLFLSFTCPVHHLKLSADGDVVQNRHISVNLETNSSIDRFIMCCTFTLHYVL